MHRRLLLAPQQNPGVLTVLLNHPLVLDTPSFGLLTAQSQGLNPALNAQQES